MTEQTNVMCGCVWETNLRTGKSILLPCARHLDDWLTRSAEMEPPLPQPGPAQGWERPE